MFYDRTSDTKRQRDQEEFIRSPYYEGFVKFGRSCVVNQYLDPERFADWLIQSGTKLDDWHKDAVYNKFLIEYVQKEPGTRALERTIIYLSEWAEESGNDWQDYFSVVPTPRAVHDIRAARISPWAIYLSKTGEELLTRFSDEQVKMVTTLIDARVWLKVFNKNSEEVDLVRAACEAAGI